MQNRDIAKAMEGLSSVSKTKLPMTLAIRMAKARRELEAHSRDIEDVRQSLIEKHKTFVEDGIEHTKELGPNHPNIGAFQDDFTALMNSEIEPPDIFTLYVKTNDEGIEEYCWTEGFKFGIIANITGETIYQLMPMLKVQAVPS